MSPGVIVLILALIAESVKRVWFESQVSEVFGRGELPAWPQSPDDPDPSLVIGEQHHRTRFEEVRNPRWLGDTEEGPVHRAPDPGGRSARGRRPAACAPSCASS